MSLYQLHHAQSFCCPVMKKNLIHAGVTAAIFFKLLQAVGQMRKVDFSSYIEIESDKSL